MACPADCKSGKALRQIGLQVVIQERRAPHRVTGRRVPTFLEGEILAPQSMHFGGDLPDSLAINQARPDGYPHLVGNAPSGEHGETGLGPTPGLTDTRDTAIA